MTFPSIDLAARFHAAEGAFPLLALTGGDLAVGADVVMFAIDYRWETTRDAVRTFERTTLSESDRPRTADGNAEQILRL